MSAIPKATAEVARRLRVQRRTRSGSRWRPWPEIADELARRGLGRFDPVDLGRAASALPIEAHYLAPPSTAQLRLVEDSWRGGWVTSFPGEPWPGLAEAQRRIRIRELGGEP